MPTVEQVCVGVLTSVNEVNGHDGLSWSDSMACDELKKWLSLFSQALKLDPSAAERPGVQPVVAALKSLGEDCDVLNQPYEVAKALEKEALKFSADPRGYIHGTQAAAKVNAPQLNPFI